MSTDYSSYDIVEFRDLTTNLTKKCRGLRIGDYLTVSGTDKRWKIYLLCTGKPLINVLFINLDEAVRVAEWLCEVFGKYFPILETYPDADLFGMVKWSIKDGIRIFEALKLIKSKRVVTQTDFDVAMKQARKHVRRWTRRPKRVS